MTNYTQIKTRLPRISTINEKDQNVPNKYKMPQIYKNHYRSTYIKLLHVGIRADSYLTQNSNMCGYQIS